MISKSEVIFISGNKARRNPTSMLMGQGVAEADAAAGGVKNRPGWDSLVD